MSLREQLPLVTSFEKTVEDWPKLSATQKLGAAAAAIVTLARPILRALQETKRGDSESHSPAELITGIVLDLGDKLDGTIARATDGVTPLGEEFDPLMDKIDFAIQEVAQYRRGTLPLGHVATRLARDIFVTLLRSHVNAVTHGEADISAGLHGKASTAARLLSLRITGLPGERDHPELRSTHQSIATGLVIASGALNVKKLLDEKANYLRNTRT